MKQSTIAKFDTLLSHATPLSSEAVAVLITHIMADDLGDRYPVNDDEHIIENKGTVLYTVDNYEPKALIHPKSGVLFLTADNGYTYAYDWASRASKMPEHIRDLVPDGDRISDAEIAEEFVNNILPYLDDELETSEENWELKELLYI